MRAFVRVCRSYALLYCVCCDRCAPERDMRRARVVSVRSVQSKTRGARTEPVNIQTTFLRPSLSSFRCRAYIFPVVKNVPIDVYANAQ